MYSTVECSTTNNLLLTFSSGPQHGHQHFSVPPGLCAVWFSQASWWHQSTQEIFLFTGEGVGVRVTTGIA